MKLKSRVLALAALMVAAQSAWSAPVDAQHPAVGRALSSFKQHMQQRALIGAGNAQFDGDDKLEARDLITDEDGTEHVRFDRRYKGLRVVGGDLVVHTQASGAHKGLERTWLRGAQLNTTPAVSGPQAMQLAAKVFPHQQAKVGNRELIVWARGGHSQLAWDTLVSGYQADGTPSRMHVILNAANGQVLDRWDDVHTHNAIGNTLYAGRVVLWSEARPLLSGQNLVDKSRGGHYVSDMGNRADLIPALVPTFGVTANTINGVFGDGTTANRNSAAADAAYGFQTTWDYYGKVHGRNGIDGNGRKAYSRVHYGSNYNNAYWTDLCFCMTYGDGDGKLMKSLVALDVAGHEMSHGLTGSTAKLMYSGESGGLNESTSDIFGSMVEFYAANASDPGDYLIGEKIAGPNLKRPYLRTMVNPSEDGASADCWYPKVGKLNVHLSSGVANHLYYLLAEGTSNGVPSRTCAAGDTRVANGRGSLQGLGRQKAEKIWYRALTVYMTSDTNFAGARQATLKAASDLFGGNSNEVASVAAAWKAVNVN
jgi:Zn-dependent metalloprotease